MVSPSSEGDNNGRKDGSLKPLPQGFCDDTGV